MKKLFTTIAFAGKALFAFAQGTVIFANNATTTIQTNLLAFGGNGPGNATAAGGPYYYELLTAPSTVTSVDPNLQQLLSGPWSDTGLEATNTGINGRLQSSGATPVSANFWPAAQTNSFIIVGWSAALGATWSAVAAQMAGAQLIAANGGAYWEGPSFVTSGFGIAWLGATTVGFRQAGGVVGSLTYPAPFLFASSNDMQGNPVTTTTELYPIGVPEPSTMAILLAGAVLVMVRSKRRSQPLRCLDN